jgi:hypothetical protein
MRVYLDNNLLFTYLSALQHGKTLRPEIALEAKALASLLVRTDIELLCSDEALAEMNRIVGSAKRSRLQQLYHRLKGDRAVIRNARVTYDDGVTRYDSPDATHDHPYTDKNRAELTTFFRSKGLTPNEYDTRYLANAMLRVNAIDVFLTADKRTIWNFRHDLKQLVGIRVALPFELLAELSSC